MAKIIVGLGNPGEKYLETRHNVGFLVADALLDALKGSSLSAKSGNVKATTPPGPGSGRRGTEKHPFRFRRASVRNEEVVVARPTTFMNESGRAVKALIEYFSVASSDCLVIVDDVNLPIGRIRFRPRGSSGAHHGLESIISALDTSNFPRLRIGIGQPGGGSQDLAKYVLGRFGVEERRRIAPEIERARDACLAWIESDSETVMQKFN